MNHHCFSIEEVAAQHFYLMNERSTEAYKSIDRQLVEAFDRLETGAEVAICFDDFDLTPEREQAIVEEYRKKGWVVETNANTEIYTIYNFSLSDEVTD